MYPPQKACEKAYENAMVAFDEASTTAEQMALAAMDHVRLVSEANATGNSARIDEATAEQATAMQRFRVAVAHMEACMVALGAARAAADDAYHFNKN